MYASNVVLNVVLVEYSTVWSAVKIEKGDLRGSGRTISAMKDGSREYD